jgi:hypothetical protein
MQMQIQIPMSPATMACSFLILALVLGVFGEGALRSLSPARHLPELLEDDVTGQHPRHDPDHDHHLCQWPQQVYLANSCFSFHLHSLLRGTVAAIDRFTSRNPPFSSGSQFTKFTTSMSQRAITVFGLVAAGGAGYYLYHAGGDPKVAQKMAQGAQLQY